MTGPTRHVTRMTIWDVGHIGDDERREIVDSYPAHERDARAKGIPQLGSGRVFPLADEAVSMPAFDRPDHWPVIGGIDFGWDHPTAAVKLAWDRDADVAYITQAYRVRETTPVIHAAALKPWGDMPWAWPRDGLNDTAAGENLAKQYRDQGLEMLPGPAGFDDGGYSVEAGLMGMLDRMRTGRLKAFAHLANWFDEFRLYHRKDGRVVKQYDDLLCATRYALMMLRFARLPGRMRAPRRARAAWPRLDG